MFSKKLQVVIIQIQIQKDDYPEVGANEKRFLNSGGFIGYAPYIYDVLTTATVRDNDDDQLYYTKIFLNKQTRVTSDMPLFSVFLYSYNYTAKCLPMCSFDYITWKRIAGTYDLILDQKYFRI